VATDAGGAVTDTAWLPALIEFDRDWNRLDEYVDRVYQVFVRDFVARRPPDLYGVRVSLRRVPEYQGKSYCFWHLVTEGPTEEKRYPVIERCERIAWPRAILEHASTAKDLPVWRNRRGVDERVLVALPDFSYVVVLQERSAREGGRFLLLLTAYPVEERHRREKLQREHDGYRTARGQGQNG
jgi:hypothetical protein